MMKKIFVLLLLMLFVMAGCKKEDKHLMTGTITFNFAPEAGNFYVFLDDDHDITNGYIIRLVATSDGPITNLEYNFRTENIPAGNYYLRGGYDQESEGSTDPENPAEWEGAGWYGSDSTNPPSTPNISMLYGTYDFMVYAIP